MNPKNVWAIVGHNDGRAIFPIDVCDRCGFINGRTGWNVRLIIQKESRIGELVDQYERIGFVERVKPARISFERLC